MPESRSGLLARLGPLGFVTAFVVVAALAAYLTSRPAQTPIARTPPAAEPRSSVEPSADASAPPTAEPAAATVDSAGEAEPADARPGPAAGEPAALEMASTERGQSSDAVVPGDAGPAAGVDDPAGAASASISSDTRLEPAAEAAGEVVDAAVAAVEPDANGGEVDAGALRFVIGERARELMHTAREALGDAPLVDAQSGAVDDRAKTPLIALVDAMSRDESLVLGIAARLDDDLGILGFPMAERKAFVVRDFFVGNGIAAERIVAGVMVPDYEPEDGVRRQVSLFLAERR